MKIRRSLKIFFTFTVMAMASVTVLSFSTLAAKYYEQGLDGGMRLTMMDVGRHADIQDNQPQQLLGFQVFNRWQDTSPEIKALFDIPDNHMQFVKKIERPYWFSVPNRALFLMRYDQPSGEILYITRVMDDLNRQDYHRDMPQDEIPQLIKLLSYALLGIGLFALCMYVLMQLVVKPVERLAVWAKQLTPGQLNAPAPDFHYNELNRLAEVVKNSLSSVENSLRREQKFLAHASHELRTPIAVVRSNAELLAKLIGTSQTEAKQQQVVGRILRAGVTVTDLCETLLWLNRGNQTEVPLIELNLGALIAQISQELSYLLSDKAVEVELNTSQGLFLLPTTLCRIVLSNLIRNAYQHTLCGKVVIRQVGSRVTISNQDESFGDAQDKLGFGLGLELTDRIIQQYQWQYKTVEHPHGRDVTIDFSRS